MLNYDHLIAVDEKSKELRIFRVEDSGKKTLFTSAPLPEGKGWTEQLEEFARELGQNILIDSPSARKLLDI